MFTYLGTLVCSGRPTLLWEESARSEEEKGPKIITNCQQNEPKDKEHNISKVFTSHIRHSGPNKLILSSRKF